MNNLEEEKQSEPSQRNNNDYFIPNSSNQASLRQGSSYSENQDPRRQPAQQYQELEDPNNFVPQDQQRSPDANGARAQVVSSYQRSRSSYQEGAPPNRSEALTFDDECNEYSEYVEYGEYRPNLGPLGSSANGKIHYQKNQHDVIVSERLSERLQRPQMDRIVHYQRESSSSCGGQLNQAEPNVVGIASQQYGVEDLRDQPTRSGNINMIRQDSNQEAYEQESYPQPEEESESIEESNTKQRGPAGREQSIDMDDQFNPIALMSALGHPSSTSHGQLMTTTDDHLQILNSNEKANNYDIINDHRQSQGYYIEQPPISEDEEKAIAQSVRDQYYSQYNPNTIAHSNQPIENNMGTGLSLRTSQLSESPQQQHPRIVQHHQRNSSSQHKRQKQQTMYQQLSPQIINNSSTKGGKKQHLDPNESLTRPAIISLSSNQKQGRPMVNQQQQQQQMNNNAGGQQISPSASGEIQVSFQQQQQQSRQGHGNTKQASYRSARDEPQQVIADIGELALDEGSMPQMGDNASTQNRHTLTLLALSQSQSNGGSQQRNYIGSGMSSNLRYSQRNNVYQVNQSGEEIEGGLDLTEENMGENTSPKNQHGFNLCDGEIMQTYKSEVTAASPSGPIPDSGILVSEGDLVPMNPMHLNSKMNQLSSIQESQDGTENNFQQEMQDIQAMELKHQQMQNILHGHQRILTSDDSYTNQLDIEEAELQAEVEQIDMLYEQHKKHSEVELQNEMQNDMQTSDMQQDSNLQMNEDSEPEQYLEKWENFGKGPEQQQMADQIQQENRYKRKTGVYEVISAPHNQGEFYNIEVGTNDEINSMSINEFQAQKYYSQANQRNSSGQLPPISEHEQQSSSSKTEYVKVQSQYQQRNSDRSSKNIFQQDQASGHPSHSLQPSFYAATPSGDNHQKYDSNAAQASLNIYNQQLNDQLQNQLMLMQNYKHICERRILELEPGHPLPVRKEHLGKNLPPRPPSFGQLNTQSELQALRNQRDQDQTVIQNLKHSLEETRRRLQELQISSQNSGQGVYGVYTDVSSNKKNSVSYIDGQQPSLNAHNRGQNSSSIEYSIQLNNQIGNMRQAIDTLKMEKQKLEESLRYETHSNEEQRSRIKILRDALENKMTTEYPQLKAMLVQNAKFKNQTGNATSGQSTNVVPSMAATQEMHPMTQARNSASNDSSAVHDNPSSIVNQYLSVALIHEENQKLRQTIAELENTLSSQQMMVDNAEDLQKAQQVEISSLKDVLNGQNGADAADNVNTLRAKIGELQQMLTLRAQDIHFYKQEVNKLQQILGRAQEENRDLQGQVHDTTAQLNYHSALEQDLDNKQGKIVDLQAQVDDLKSKLQDTTTHKQSLQQKIQQDKSRVSQFKERVENEGHDKIQLLQRLDEVQLKLDSAEQELKLAVIEKETAVKRGNMEVLTMQNILKQNKDYSHGQDKKILEITQQYQKELLTLREKYEKHEVERVKEIGVLKRRVGEAEQKSLTAQLEKTQVNETCLENNNYQQSYELEVMKTKQLEDKIQSLSNQITQLNVQMNAGSQRVLTMEKKAGQYVEQIETLKGQNIWLKEEREKLRSDGLASKDELAVERKRAQDVAHKLNLIENQIIDQKSQLSYELDRKNKENQQLSQKLGAIEGEKGNLQTQNKHLQEAQKQIEKNLLEFQSDLNKERREKGLLERQLEDLREENDQLYRNEERTKRLITETESLKSKNNIMVKEVLYGDQKLSDLHTSMSRLENENRMLQRDIKDLEDKVHQAQSQKDCLNSQTIDYAQECTSLKRLANEKDTEIAKLVSEIKRLGQRNRDVEGKLGKQEAYSEDVKDQLSRHIIKSNDHCLKFEQNEKLVEGIRLIQSNANECVIKPFIKAFRQQVEVSDILKGCLTGMVPPLEEDDASQAPTGRSFESQRPIERAIDIIERQTEPFLKIETEHELADVLLAQRQIIFEYVKFLQQDIIEKVIAAMLSQKSSAILLMKKNSGLVKQLAQMCDLEARSRGEAELLREEVQRLTAKLSENGSNEKRMLNQTAGLRQKIKNLEGEKDMLLEEQEHQGNVLLSLTQHKETTESNKHILDKQMKEMRDIHEQQEIESLEKKNLWKLLKSVKTFFKSDEAFQPLVVMMNEYIILLEQIVFDKKQQSKKIGGLLTMKDTQAIFSNQQKLKVVENDIKTFRLPLDIQNSLLPDKNDKPTSKTMIATKDTGLFSTQIPQDLLTMKQNYYSTTDNIAFGATADISKNYQTYQDHS